MTGRSNQPRILFVLRSRFGLAGTNASYRLPQEVAKQLPVRVVEGPDSASEQDMIVVKRGKLDIVQIDEIKLVPRLNQLCEQIESFKPDIVHIFYHHQAIGLAKGVRERFGKSLTITLDIRTPLLEEQRRRRFARQWNAIKYRRLFDRVFTHSAASIPTIYPLLPPRFDVISYGVDTDAITYGKSKPAKKQGFQIVYAGAIARRRRIAAMLEGFGKVLDKYPESELHLIGAGNRLNNIRTLAGRDRFKGKIIIHGLIPQDKLFSRLHKFDVGLSWIPLDLYKSAPALKTLEYCAAGLPVVASRTKAAENLVKQGFSLELFDNQPDSMLDAVERIATLDATTRASNRELCRSYDWAEIVRQTLIPIYISLCEKRIGDT